MKLRQESRLPAAAAAAAAAAKSLQSCPTLCDPIDDRPPGSPIPGILQARGMGCHFLGFLLLVKCFFHPTLLPGK